MDLPNPLTEETLQQHAAELGRIERRFQQILERLGPPPLWRREPGFSTLVLKVLRARGEIRNEFRLPQTTFKARDNNPLKLAVNAEDAIHNLLVKRNPAYLGTTAAFDDAFKDVRHHQLAMLAGMRAAYAFMLQRFDPQTMKAQFDAKPGRKGFGFGTQGRYWEAFEEYYREVTADSDDCFRRLFGDQFARAYEEQIQLLRAARDRTKNQT